uniref:Leucine rich repeat containing 72 n=1 Tax=Apteryx owenii TaxID=8824 RepID=A0A8B9PZL4_APTOW
LYLNNNEVTDISDTNLPFVDCRYGWITRISNSAFFISGALKHLCALQILLLHNNQLKKLGKTVEELKGMISLQTLNLFHNTLAQDPGYRLYVIYFLPSVQLLDRKPVTQREREAALHVYNHKRSHVVQSIAFGNSTAVWKYSDNLHLLCSLCRVPFENPTDAVFLRAMTRSIMEFSSVDWNKVSTCQERRLENKAEEPHEKLTVKLR